MVRGLSTSNPVGPTNDSTGTSSTTDPGSVTPTVANNLAVAFTFTETSFSSGPTNGFYQLAPATSGSIIGEMGYLIQSTTAAADTSWTFGSSSNWDALMVDFNGTASTSTGDFYFSGVMLNGLRIN